MAAAIMNAIQNAERNNVRRRRVFRRRIHPIEEYSNDVLRKKYRLSRGLILDLYDQFGESLESETNRNHAVKGIDKICLALRFYATGSFQDVIAEGFGVHRSTASRIISKVTDEICRLRNQCIKFPMEREEVRETKRQFHDIRGFPNVLGAIDGTLISIAAPMEEEHLYVTGRKTGHYLNVLAVCNANLKFTYVVSKYPGSSNDGYILANSALYRKFIRGEMPEGWLMGDSGFALRPFLLTPVLRPRNDADGNYNRSFKPTRAAVERAFGVLKQRFRCLHKSGGELVYDPKKCCKIVLACMILHNMCIEANVPLDDDSDDEDDGSSSDDDGEDDEEEENRRNPNPGWLVRERLIAARFQQQP